MIRCGFGVAQITGLPSAAFAIVVADLNKALRIVANGRPVGTSGSRRGPAEQSATFNHSLIKPAIALATRVGERFLSGPSDTDRKHEGGICTMP